MSTAARSIARLWWVRLPLLAARFAPGLGSALTDGLHLARWPVSAAVAPVAALLFGVLMTLALDGRDVVSSVPLLLGLTVLALAALPLGAAAWLGCLVTDLVVTRAAPRVGASFAERFLGTPLAFVAEHLVLGVLALAIPAAVLAARLDLRSRGLDRRWGAGEVAAHLALAAILTTCWVRSLPVLIRPVFSLRGETLALEAVMPSQRWWWAVVAAAVAGAAARRLSEWWALGPTVINLVVSTNAALAQVAGRRRSPFVVRLATVAAGTFLLGGFLQSVFSGAVTAAALWGLLALRDHLATSGWARHIDRIPLAVRCLAGLGLGFALIRVVLATVELRLGGILLGWRTDSFLPALVAALLAIAAITLLALPASPAVAGES